jgi:predicted unusual protein kinase regulating ubiquinone biosynthesis (AarF/ABC1/UbiB family)
MLLKPRNLGAYRDLLLLLTRYGLKDFRLALDPDDMILADDEAVSIEPDVQQRANAFATRLKEMGPTYVKFGQVLSTRPDVVPPEYIAALESLQDNVEPFSFAEVETIVEEELGVRISKAFDYFEATPLAAASLGQVHRALLRDGREVVVKVQRPNVREQVKKDLQVFTDIATALEEHTEIGRRMNLLGAIEQARITMMNELNYLQEAHNSEILRLHLAEFPAIYIPAVIHDLTTSRVLTTELVHGRKISKLTPLALLEHDYAELAVIIMQAYLKQICVDGLWHSDPHPGNVFLREVDANFEASVAAGAAGFTRNGASPATPAPTGETRPQLVLLDFGMVSRISGEFQDEIIKLLLAIAANRGEDVAGTCVRISEVQEKFDAAKFTQEISTIVAGYHDTDIRQLNTGQLIFHVISVANNNDLKMPAELAMLAKTLLHLDGITKRLDPNFNPVEVMRHYAERLVGRKLQQKFNPRNFYPALLDLNQLVLDLPHRTREILAQTADGRLTFGMKLTQAEELLGGMHKIANRITVGVVIAALLISSALTMRAPTRMTIFGYPFFAAIGYILAVAAALYLIISTFARDRKDEERAKLKGK